MENRCPKYERGSSLEGKLTGDFHVHVLICSFENIVGRLNNSRKAGVFRSSSLQWVKEAAGAAHGRMCTEQEVTGCSTAQWAVTHHNQALSVGAPGQELCPQLSVMLRTCFAGTEPGLNPCCTFEFSRLKNKEIVGGSRGATKGLGLGPEDHGMMRDSALWEGIYVSSSANLKKLQLPRAFFMEQGLVEIKFGGLFPASSPPCAGPTGSQQLLLVNSVTDPARPWCGGSPAIGSFSKSAH